MTAHRQQILAVLRAATVTTPTSFTWFGKAVRVVRPRAARGLTPENARTWLAAGLQRRLYTNFHCFGAPIEHEPRVVRPPSDGMTPFVERLSDANTGQGVWQSGWRVVEAGEDLVVAERGGLTLRLEPEHIRPDPSGRDGAAQVWMPKELFSASPGFYVALGDADLPADDAQDLWRFYWRLPPDGAVRFMRAATALLNAAGLPFHLKMIASGENYARHDAVVLYVSAAESARVFALLPALVRACDAYLLPGGPALTLELVPGLSWAEEPGTGESFGWSRCGIIARAIVRAHEQGECSLEGRLRVVEDEFRAAGIDPERPFLRSADAATPAFPALTVRRAPAPTTTAPPQPASFLSAARRIGERICDDAIWHEGRCTWIGVEPADIRDADGADREAVYRTLGPDLYDGVAGVAVFLADLHAATGDPRARATAAGAIRQALHRLDEIPPTQALGLHSGRLGVAWAAVRAGAAIAAPDLERDGLAAARRIIRDYDGNADHDLMAGRAGGILAALALARAARDPAFVAFAARLGDELLDAADRDRRGWSWPTAPAQGHPNLTGLAHGAAGIGAALLELYRATAGTRFRHGAQLALAYERSWFDADAANWPDLRPRTGRVAGGAVFMAAWCHGAPGIALSRAHAHAVLGDGPARAEAIAALGTTRAAIAQALEAGADDLSLCHGVAGNALIAIEAARGLGAAGARDETALAEAVGVEAIRRRAGPEGRWSAASETPGLMLGLAGIGHFYLRLHDKTLASVLLPVAAGAEARVLKIAC